MLQTLALFMYHAFIVSPKTLLKYVVWKEDLILASTGNLCGQPLLKIISRYKQRNTLCIMAIFTFTAILHFLPIYYTDSTSGKFYSRGQYPFIKKDANYSTDTLEF